MVVEHIDKKENKPYPAVRKDMGHLSANLLDKGYLHNLFEI